MITGILAQMMLHLTHTPSTKGRCQKHPGGGSLKFSAEGCKTLTPPKNSSTDMYPPLNCQQQLNFVSRHGPPLTLDKN